jgi:LAO/AO transport system kinase
VSELDAQVDRALEGHKHSIARLVSVFEDRRPAAAEARAQVLAALEAHPAHRTATFLGVTGTPGAGKSTLIATLAERMLVADESLRLAVLAVDPSSRFSGGALLGDRTRLRSSSVAARLYFRSQAADTALGGLSPTSFQVCRLLYRLFDGVIVETVGIGQSEIDVRFLADRVYLVLQPMAGDEVQFLKAGIMEVPDEIILNKCDAAEAARKSHLALLSSLRLARPFDADRIPVHQASARTGFGLDPLARRFAADLGAYRRPDLRPKEAHYFEEWVKDEWGRTGSRFLASHAPDVGGYLARLGGYDAAQRAFGEALRRAISAE